MRYKVLLFLPVLIIAACSARTLYHPEPGLGHFGYSELPIDSTRYEVSFTGDYDTPTQTIDQYALYRSAEITASRRFDYFVVEHTRHWSENYHHRVQRVTTNKVRMYHGTWPQHNSNSYDAKELLSVMGPTIRRDH